MAVYIKTTLESWGRVNADAMILKIQPPACAQLRWTSASLGSTHEAQGLLSLDDERLRVKLSRRSNSNRRISKSQAPVQRSSPPQPDHDKSARGKGRLIICLSFL